MSLSYWGDGQPLFRSEDKDTRGLAYWGDGAPIQIIAGLQSAIKTINGLARANVKTINGLDIANMKTWGGLA
jgi:hypothetical protein